jgi:flagellin
MEVQGTGGALLAGSQQIENALADSNQQLEKILEQLATARRINSASDDAAGLGIAGQLTNQVRGFKQASQNIADASASLDIAGGAGSDISGILQQQRDLALQASGDAVSDTDRASLNTEYQALSDEISRVAEVTSYNQLSVANGTALASGSAQVQVGANAGDTIALPAVDFASIGKSQQATSIDTAANAQAALTSVDQALDSVNNQQSSVGATMNRLSSAGDSLSTAIVNSQAAESVEGDEDIATGLADLTRQQILQEGAIRTFSRYNEITQNHILGLLQ